MEYYYSAHEIDLQRTCEACPEQYDAYKDGQYVGYLRLRHGKFSVDYISNGELVRVWDANPKGDGIFEYEERDYYLEGACRILSVCAF